MCGDTSIIHVVKPLYYNNNLRFLNISKNKITDKGAEVIAEMLVMNNTLRVLFIHWNKIRSIGGAALARALKSNNTLQILDLSFNNIGSTTENQVSSIMREAFTANQSLNHIDVSHCNFNQIDIEIMNEGLIQNHTIMGIHLLGNYGTTDSLGFVHPKQVPDQALS